MAALKIWIGAAMLAIAGAGRAESVADWRPYTVQASSRFGIPAAWIERVIYVETRGRTTQDGRPIRSAAGAMGLMQLMPATWGEMRARLGLGTNPDDPRDNILAGTFYLRLMYERFGYPGLFAAYNAGPTRYAERLAGGRALPPETVSYVATVASREDGADIVSARSPRSGQIFALREELGTDESAAWVSSPASPLFFALSRGK
ncbi:MAG: lytic transglycosylase domain-containing protein [Novosphingobium sp.]|nr:lytic transglycosylase domain-containing protein [Novosphingobium sp.]